MFIVWCSFKRRTNHNRNTHGDNTDTDIIGAGEHYTDPLPQALVLTAIVIGFAMTAFVVALALRARGELDNDHVDGQGAKR